MTVQSSWPHVVIWSTPCHHVRHQREFFGAHAREQARVFEAAIRKGGACEVRVLVSEPPTPDLPCTCDPSDFRKVDL